jgi:predicted permease
MGWLRRLRARIKYRHFETDLREEIETHRSLKEADLQGRGASPADARTSASRAMGNVTLAREDARGVWLAPWLESVWQDARYAVRSLRKSPGYAVAAILTLGLGIGLNVSVFTMFNVLALKSWDVRHAGETVLPFMRPVGNRGFINWMPYAEYAHMRDNSETLSALVARTQGSGRVFQSEGTAYDRPFDYVQFQGVSANFFDALGIEIIQGRGFQPGEDAVGTPAPVTVITHAFWQNQLGGDPNVLGRTLRIGVRSVAVTVVGVTRRGFAGLETTRPQSLFVPLPLERKIDGGTEVPWDPDDVTVTVAGRLKLESTRTAAEAELDTLSRQFRSAAKLEGNGLILTGTRPIEQPGQTARFAGTFAAFGAAVLLVLLLACANVGNLQLARAFARQRELAVRLSLGAARARLVRQLLTEAAGLGTVAAGLGLAIAWFLPNVVLRLMGEDEDELIFQPDGAVVAVALLLGGATVLFFALAPALRATRGGHVLALRSRTDIDRGGRRLRSLLLASQVALSLTLLTGASLLTRGMMQAHQMDFGFDADAIAVARIRVPQELYTRSALTTITRELDTRFASTSIGPTSRTNIEPLNDSPFVAHVRRPDEAENWDRRTFNRQLTPAGFELLGLTFVAGRPYSELPDTREAVINETLARQLWPNEDAVGRTVLAETSRDTYERYTITGVVRDVHYTSPMSIDPVFFRPPVLTSTSVLFRNGPSAAAEAQALITAIEPRLQVVTIEPITTNITSALEQRRFAAGLAWAIGILGLTLATVGVFGVFAYAVEERRREIGVRLALGARARDVFRALFDVNRWSVGGGLVVGLMLSVAAGFVLRSYLFGLSPVDPLAYLAVGGLMGFAALLATAVPARRALRVDPAVTLKSE